MTLYLYKTGTSTPVMTIENAVSYTADSAVTEDGAVYSPFAEDVELSSRPDCSEALRADWRRDHPSAEQRMEALSMVAGIAFVTLAEGGQIDDVTAGEHAELFAAWEPDVSYEVGSIRAYGGRLYRCVQAHTSQTDWTPDTAVSLWAQIADPAEEWPEWSRPVGAHDAYSAGDKVSHGGQHWVSDLDGNVWEPGVYGWTETK